MEDSGAFLNLFVDPNSKAAVHDVHPPTDLGLFFSSPATDIEDASLSHGFAADPNIMPVQFPSLTPRQEHSTQFDAFLTSAPPALDYHAVPDLLSAEHLDHHSALSSPQPKRELSDSQPSLCCSGDESQDPMESACKATSRIKGRKRRLEAMRSVAEKNAPNVSLSDPELIKISTMYESDAQVAESKEIYATLVALKKCLAKHGYRIKSLSLDVIPSEEAMAECDERPFDFILDKNPQTSRPGSVKSEFSGIHDESSEDVAAKRLSVTMSATTSSGEGEGDSTPPEADERPRKRSRVLGNGEQCSGSGGHRLSCVVCSRKMSDFGNLVRHFRHVHQELKPFMCPKCGGYYSSEGTLWHHINNVHTDSRRTHKCEFCDASYDSSGAKTRHVNGTHHGMKPTFSCGFRGCDRTFVFPAHLERHALTEHEGYKPFECRQCLKAFSSCNGLTRHEREVHRTEKAYTCPICETGITKRCHLKRHLQNVHRLTETAVEEEMKKHPNPADLSAITNSRLSA